MRTTVEIITPDKAKEYLKANVDNRALREQHIQFLAQQIRTGNWQLTHQGIAFSLSGRLLDGQHRLFAIIAAGIAAKMTVTRDLDESTFKVIDCGTMRAHFDRVHLVNDKAMNRRMCQLISAYLRLGTRFRGAVPISDMEDEFLRRSASWQWAAGNFGAHTKDGVNRAGTCAAIAIYHSVHPKKAELFGIGFRTGEDLSRGSPMLALRRTLMGMTNSEFASYWKAMSAIKAHMEGRELVNLVEAAEDILGNKNSFRLIAARREQHSKPRRKVVA